MFTADELIRRLRLAPLPVEGGFFRETYRSPATQGERSAGTAIYYLLAEGSCSRLHRLRGDEIYHFYLGDPVELLLLTERGGERRVLGHDLASGQEPQLVVPGGAWQGSRLLLGGKVALLGTTMAPGFDPRDFELGERAALEAAHPAWAALIRALC